MRVRRLHELDASAAAERLPAAAHALLPLLAADSEALRFEAARALGGLIGRCLDDGAVMRAVILAGLQAWCCFMGSVSQGSPYVLHGARSLPLPQLCRTDLIVSLKRSTAGPIADAWALRESRL